MSWSVLLLLFDYVGYGIITRYLKLCSRFLLHICYTTWYTTRQTHVPRNLTRGTELRGSRPLPSPTTSTTDLCAPEYILFPVYFVKIPRRNSTVNGISLDL